MDYLALKTIGHGTALSNCNPMEVEIQVLIHELFSFHDGEVKSTPTEVKKTTLNARGDASSDSILVDHGVKAKWLPSGSNRKSAPNVRVGEQVEVLQQGDTDIYWWRPLGLDEGLRRLETIIFGISGSPTESNDDPDSMYWVEFSSHSKQVCLTTSRKNGENTIYHIGINPGKGTFQLIDEVGNELFLDSNVDRWLMTTTQGTSVELIERNMNVNVPGDLTYKVGGNMTAKVGGNVSINAGGPIELIGQGSTLKIAGGGITWKAPTFTGST